MSLLLFWQEAAGPTIVEADAASAGVATTSGIAAAVFLGVGGSNGVGAASVNAASVAVSEATSSGAPSVSGVASAIWDVLASSEGAAHVYGDTEYVGSATSPAGVSGGRGSRRRRSFVDIDGQLIEVSGYEEAERLLTELKKEEKAQEQDKKKLRFAVKKYQVDLTTKVRPQQIEVIENRMDARAEKIAALYERILSALEQDEDEEELMLLS